MNPEIKCKEVTKKKLKCINEPKHKQVSRGLDKKKLNN